MTPFPNARYVFTERLPDLDSARYLMLRPTSEVGDYTITSEIDDNETVQIQVGGADKPPHLIAKYDEVEDAMTDLIAIQARRSEIALWYDGHEVYDDLGSDPWHGLAVVLSDMHDEYEGWDLIYRLGNGEVTARDKRVKDLAMQSDLYAAAIKGVKPRRTSKAARKAS
jgi:hypothetical protein